MAAEAPQLLVLYEGLLVVAKDLPRQKALWEALRRAHPASSEL